jgi:hypothetical protein
MKMAASWVVALCRLVEVDLIIEEISTSETSVNYRLHRVTTWKSAIFEMTVY